jgi:hypothetical protein
MSAVSPAARSVDHPALVAVPPSLVMQLPVEMAVLAQAAALVVRQRTRPAIPALVAAVATA